jgi:hypothetical protein
VILLYCLLALLHSFITVGTVYDESGVCCFPGQSVLVEDQPTWLLGVSCQPLNAQQSCHRSLNSLHRWVVQVLPLTVRSSLLSRPAWATAVAVTDALLQ